MTMFWAIAAALLLLAMGLLAAALLRHQPRSDETKSASRSNLAVLKAQLQQLEQDRASGCPSEAQYQQSRAEIERRVLEEESVATAPERAGSPRATLVLVLVAVPVLALALYGVLGSPQALSPQAVAAASPHGEVTQQDMQALVAKLAERMEKRPPGQVADTEGWVMLGRSYAAMQRYPEAQRAFVRALQLMPNEAQILADQADVLAMLNGRNLEGEPMTLIEKALKNDPSNLKALALAGTAAFERKDYAGALNYWGRARAAAPPDSEFTKGLEGGMAEARAAAGGSVLAVPAPPPQATAAANATTAPTAPAAPTASAGPGLSSINGRVSLAPALAARVAPGDTVFIFARAAEGPRMPLAILKRTVGDLPAAFTLDDSMAMAPQFKLSSFPSVVVGARVSKSGNATPQSGDLEVTSAPISGRAGDVELVIDSVRP